MNIFTEMKRSSYILQQAVSEADKLAQAQRDHDKAMKRIKQIEQSQKHD